MCIYHAHEKYVYFGGSMLVKDKKKARFNINTTVRQKEYVEKQAAKLGISISEFIRGLINDHKHKSREDELRSAARSLMDDYTNDTELTVFSEIDGDDFL
jgi:hypothetical protein